MQHDFKATIANNNTDIYGIHAYLKIDKGIDIDTSDSSVKIEYSINLNLKEYGIRSIDVSVEKVSFEINWVVENCFVHPETDDESLSYDDVNSLLKAGGEYFKHRHTIEGKVSVDTTKFISGEKWEVNIEDFQFNPSGHLSINEIQIDFTKLKISIS